MTCQAINFTNVDSMTAAGGAGIYVCNSLKVIERPDIKFSMDLVESCWVEIEPGYQKKKHHCEGSRGLGPRFGLRLGLRLGLTFNCIQSFKSRLFEPLFLATFKVFFTVNEQ